MQFEVPTSSRVSVDRVPEGTNITVRAKRRTFLMAFLLFWLCGWTIGGFAAAGALVSGGADGKASLFLLVWLGAWALGWLYAAATLFWMFAGRETLVVSRAGITKTVSIPILSRSWHYNPAHVAHVRRHQTEQQVFSPRAFENPLGANGGVAFGYGHKTVTFGTSIDDAEARLIIEALNSGLGRREAAA